MSIFPLRAQGKSFEPGKSQTLPVSGSVSGSRSENPLAHAFHIPVHPLNSWFWVCLHEKSLKIPWRPGKPAGRYQQKRDSSGKQILLAEAQNGIILYVQVCTAIMCHNDHRTCYICRGVSCKYSRVIYLYICKHGIFVITVMLWLMNGLCVVRVFDAPAGLSDNLTDYHGDEFQLKTGDGEWYTQISDGRVKMCSVLCQNLMSHFLCMGNKRTLIKWHTKSRNCLSRFIRK